MKTASMAEARDEDRQARAIAERIRLERETRGWSLAELAARSAVSKAMISKVERCEASPTATVLGRLSGAFGLPLSVLLALAEREGDRLTRQGQQPVWTDPATSGQVHIVVRDAATGRVTPCRVNVVGPDGNFHQPQRNHLSLYALTGSWPKPGSKGNRVGKAPFRYVGRFFYTNGDVTVPVSAGQVRVEVWKGLEYRPETATVQVGATGTSRVEINLTRTAPMAPAGYYAGDSHLHFNRLEAEDDRILFDLLEAEDFRYGCVLTYNEPAGPYAGVMGTGRMNDLPGTL